MKDWKQQAAQQIVKHEPVAAAPSNDQEIARALLQNYPNIAERDTQFARSLIDGFTKYGSFTDKQRPHAARLAGLAAPAPIVPHTPLAACPTSGVSDAQLAERLGDYLPRLAARDVDFATSLLAGFKRYGSFTDRQRPHVGRLVAQFHTDGDAPAAPAAKLYPNLCKVVSLDAFAHFSVGDFKASLKNDGSVIWLKFDGTLFGSVNTASHAFRALPRGLSDDATKRAIQTLDIIEADPAKAAKESGILTGRCSCCSRPLTDPQSIEIGIGPICLAKAGW
jgi:hypothetical protein